jgi:hypothetical protein
MLILKVINVAWVKPMLIGGASYNQRIEFNRVRYYDRDIYQDPKNKTNVEMALTEYGWYRIARDDKDTKWIENLPDNIQINQINIPGTHDSGTYAIGDTGFNLLPIRDDYGRTQEANIYDQLMNGVRYFDIRLESNDEKEEIYLTHGGLDCMNRNTGKKYYLSDVFNEAIDFLHLYEKETVIMHLKDDAIKVKIPGGFDTIDDLIQAIANGSVLNEAAKYDKKYKEFFYTGEVIYPLLKDVTR